MKHVYWTDHDFEHNESDRIEWWQVHVRIWVRDDGKLDVMPHFETRPYTADRSHINGVGWETERAVGVVGQLFDEQNINLVSDPRAE